MVTCTLARRKATRLGHLAKSLAEEPMDHQRNGLEWSPDHLVPLHYHVVWCLLDALDSLCLFCQFLGIAFYFPRMTKKAKAVMSEPDTPYDMIVEGEQVVRAPFEPYPLLIHELPLQVAKGGHLYTGRKKGNKAGSSASESAKYKQLSAINYSDCACANCAASAAIVNN